MCRSIFTYPFCSSRLSIKRNTARNVKRGRWLLGGVVLFACTRTYKYYHSSWQCYTHQPSLFVLPSFLSCLCVYLSVCLSVPQVPESPLATQLARFNAAERAGGRHKDTDCVIS